MAVEHREVRADEADLRLDRWFKRHFPEVPHGRLEKMLRKGEIRVDGGRAKANQRLEAGQNIRIPPLGGIAEAVAAQPREYKVSKADIDRLESAVLYCDSQVLALNKPAGLAVQGGSGTTKHLDGMLPALNERLPVEGDVARLVHRLDRDTSGVMVLGRGASAAAALARNFRAREAEKVYWALVVGVPNPPEGTIRAALSKEPGKRGERVGVDVDEGKVATTDFTTIDSALRKAAWLALKPRTGRTHQLRVHCAEVLGTPILGDGKYGGGAAHPGGAVNSKMMHLHARALRLMHPDGSRLDLAAPLPPHMAQSMEFFGFEQADAVDAFAAFEALQL